jgi:hypothetical protein
MPIERETYRRINEAFPKKLAYHLGSRSGFFAEYVNMLQGIVYCLQNNIQFQLYSKDANFATHHGWTDFFEPFCVEQTSPLHRVFNPRFPTPKFRFQLRKAGAPVVKMLCNCHYLSYEIWSGMNANRLDTSPISLDAVGLNGTAMDIFREVTSMTWRLKSSIRGQIESIQQHLALPETYGAIHIRSGDKIKEAKPFTHHAYIERLQTTADVEGIFVLTDDYNNFRQLVQDYPQLSFYTLEREHQTGYHHRINKRRSRNEKQLDYLNFLASIEIAAAAKTYVGTFSSNVSTFLRIRMDEHKCHAVDR